MRLGLLALGAMLVALLAVQVSSPGASLHAQSSTAPAPTGLSEGSPTDKEFAIGSSVDFALPAASSGDPPLVYSVSSPPSGLSFSSSSRSVSGTPDTEGSTNVTYTVRDINGDSDTAEFDIEITDETPCLPTVSDRSGTVGASVRFTLPSSPCGDGTISYSVSGLPSGLSFNSTTHVVSGTLSTAQTKNVQYTATDADGDTDTESFSYEVAGTGPTCPSLSDQSGMVDEPIDTITLDPASGGSGTLSYSVTNLSSGLTFTSSSRTIKGTPSTAHTKNVTYKDTDSANKSCTSSFSFRIAPDRMPIFNGSVSDHPGTTGVILTITLPLASGGDGSLSYSVDGEADGMAFTNTATVKRLSGPPALLATTESPTP